jgi:hypothetical protein
MLARLHDWVQANVLDKKVHGKKVRRGHAFGGGDETAKVFL